VQGDVPEVLKGVRLLSLDLGLLSAGAGVRGEFESRLKGVIQEVKASPVPVILFIDEAHTLIGAGGEAGKGDAANLLKPELARGEMKCIAATTFSEFRKYLEKDPAIARRFQQVVIPEPDAASAAVMLRGLRERYEEFHKVRISHEAVEAACDLSDRYVPGRQLPDKAVDLLDTAAARVRMGLTTRPAALVMLDQEILDIGSELDSLEHDESLKPGVASLVRKGASTSGARR
jgi:type VI secretion system protein VasG